MKNTIWKKNNQGSTLLLVVVAIAFIGVLSSMVITMTMMNIQMKAVDEQSKENFYTAEETLQEIKGSLEEVSAQALQESYNEILTKYSYYTENSINITDEFDRLYLNKVKQALTVGNVLVDGAYDTDVIKSHMSARKDNFLNDSSTLNEITIEFDAADPSSKRFVKLKNIQVSYEDTDTKQLTKLVTDIVLYSPGMTFTTSSSFPEFSKYTIIADQQFKTSFSNLESKVNGNLYSGANGIVAEKGKLTLTGNLIITRGNIVADNGTELTIGETIRYPEVYAENIVTDKLMGSGVTDTVKLTLMANCYISNDLILNAKNSQVSVAGTYTGYSYNTENQLGLQNNSNYSSAIIVNGKNCSVDLTGLTTLFLAGHTFISRTSETSIGGSPSPDILMGQSIGVKSNQTMYLIQDQYFVSGHNPMTRTEFVALSSSESPADILVDESSIPDSIKNKLSTAKVAKYYYQVVGVGELVYFYWDFKNQESANAYFEEYISDNAQYAEFEKQMKNYIDDSGNKIIMSDGMIIKNAGSIFKYNAANGKYEIVAEVDNPFADADVPTGTTLTDLINIAYKYKARQLCLKPSMSSMDITSIRLTDKTSDPLFASIISQVGGESVIANEASQTDYGTYGFDANRTKTLQIDRDGDGSKDSTLVFVDNKTTGNSYYIGTMPGGLASETGKSGLRGIVVATGDVVVNADFDGLVIAGGTIEMLNGDVNMDVALVQEILKYGIDNYPVSTSAQKFVHYFTQYEAGAGGSYGNVGSVNISSSITYENWKKNVD